MSKETGEFSFTCEAELQLRRDLYLQVEIKYTVSRDWCGACDLSSLTEGLDVDAVHFVALGPPGRWEMFDAPTPNEGKELGTMAALVFRSLRETLIDWVTTEPILSWAREQAAKDWHERQEGNDY